MILKTRLYLANLWQCKYNIFNLLFRVSPDTHARELPTLLHCAAKFGLKNLALHLLQCSGATWAAQMKNVDGSDMLHLAERHGHEELKKILEDVMVSLFLSLYICGFFFMCTCNINMNILLF